MPRIPLDPSSGRMFFKLQANFFNIAHYTVNKGEIMLFWKDIWHSNTVKNLYP